MPIMTAEDLRAARIEMDLKQVGMAAALSLTPQFVGMMERGEKPIEPRTALAVRYLLEHPEARPSDADVYEEPEVWDVTKLATAYANRGNDVVDGREWGPWRLDAKAMTLDFQSKVVLVDHDSDGAPIMGRRERYYVRLVEIRNGAEALRWIAHIARKPWGPPATGYFVEALNDIFGLHQLGYGEYKFVDEDDVGEFLERRTRADA